MTTAFDSLAEHYDAGRTGYSNDIYNALAGYGLNARYHVLDIACGTGLASKPLIENGYRVTGVDCSEKMLEKARDHLPTGTWVLGSAEALPFSPGSFDAAICAQAAHHVDRAKMMTEIVRALRPGGIIGVWWKSLMGDDPVKMIRDSVVSGLGAAPLPSGVTGGGFKEFYATKLADHTLRVIPWRCMVTLNDYMRYERSRKNVQDAFGKRTERYFEGLLQRLHEQYGKGNPMIPLSYLHFLYMGKTGPAT